MPLLSDITGTSLTTYKFPTLGESLVLTKASVVHPHRASSEVGIVMFKRLVTHNCTGDNPTACTKGTVVADVFKMAHVIKCQHKVFANTNADGTATEIKDFVTNCLSKAVHPDGKLKQAYNCTDWADLHHAEAAIAGF